MQLFTHLTVNDVKLDSFPFKREISLQAYLIENEGVLALDQSDFSDVEIVETELPIEQGRKTHGTDGRIDILATYSGEYLVLVELKIGELEEIHLTQLVDYLKEKDQILSLCKEQLSEEIQRAPKWIGVLVGSSISENLAAKINQNSGMPEGILIAALIIQRFRGSDGSIYVTTDTYFNPPSSSRDKSKYDFDGVTFGKSSLVLAVLKRYVETHPTVTYAELQKEFPRELQGSNGVFSTATDANEIYTRTSMARHFIKTEEQLIKLSDATIAVCNQWTTDNIRKFVEKAKSLKFNITVKI